MSETVIHITNGNITNKTAIRSAFNTLKDGSYLMRLDSFKKRTLPQNAYYHAVVVPLVKDGLRDAGYDEVKTNEQAHEIMKKLFLETKYENKKNGDVIKCTGSTTKLTTIEFNAFLEDIWKWAAEYLGLNIPEPNSQLIMFATYQPDDKLTLVEPYPENNLITITE